MAPDRRSNLMANATRIVLAAGIGYLVWQYQTLSQNVSTLQQDVAYIKGQMSGGRRDR